MRNFKYFTPTKVILGRETETQTGELVEELGCKKVLIHYGGGSAVRSGLLERVKMSLDGQRVAHVELGGVVPDFRLSLVYEGIELAKREQVDFVLVVGGGSTIDLAKAIGYGMANEGDVWKLYDRKRQATGCLSIGVILTIAATGSEMSDSSVTTKEDGRVKCGYSSDFGRPVFAIMNPELAMTLPDHQTACGRTDILIHIMERYFTPGGNMEITDSVSEALMHTVITNSITLQDEPDNYGARAEVMWTGSLSHNGLAGCDTDGGDFATHMLEHEIGGLYDVAHGAGLVAVWGSQARHVYKDCLRRFHRFAVNVMVAPGESTPEEVALKGIKVLEEFFRSIHMPTSLSEMNSDLTEEEVKLMTHKCSAAAGGAKGSAKVLHEEDMLVIYEVAR